MAENEKWISSEGKEIIVYIAIGLLFCIIAPLVGGFIFGGFEESFASGTFNISSYLGNFIVYFFMILGSLFVVIYPIGRLVAGDRKDHPATRTNPNWFTMFTVSLINAPEENGALFRLFNSMGLKKNPMRWSLSIFRCFMYSIILFGLLGIVQVSYPQLQIAGVPSTTQQISPASDVIFGAGIPSFSENGVLCLIFFFLLGIDAYICSKFKLGLGAFFIIGFLVICPLMGFTWMGIHKIVYSGSDAKLLATFIFGWIGSTLTLLTGVFIWWLVWHFMNNAFIKLAEVITVKEDLTFITLLILGGVILITIVAEILIYRYKKKKSQAIIIPE